MRSCTEVDEYHGAAQDQSRDDSCPHLSPQSSVLSPWSLVLERQNHIRKHVVQRLLRFINVRESAAGMKAGHAAADDDVVAEERAIAKADADVLAEMAVDVALKQHLFERLRRI